MIRTPPERAVIHCVEMHDESNPKEAARKLVAKRSWDALYEQGVIPVHVWAYPRNALAIGDSRPLPYLRDVLAVALTQASDADIVFWTNDDDVLHGELPDLLRFHISLYECCSSARCEFKDIPMPSLSSKPSVFATNGRGHMGRDLFAATRAWWMANLNEIPDFILGASEFDLCLAAIVRLHFGFITSRSNLELVMFPADLPRGYVSHQWHQSRWSDPKIVDSAPSQLHNRRLFQAWATKHAPELKFQREGVI